VLWIHAKHDLSLVPTGGGSDRLPVGTDPIPAGRHNFQKPEPRVVWVIETSCSRSITADMVDPFALLASSDWSTSATQASRQLAIELDIFLVFELQKIENSSPDHL
jgi:hypothetical protein